MFYQSHNFKSHERPLIGMRLIPNSHDTDSQGWKRPKGIICSLCSPRQKNIQWKPPQSLDYQLYAFAIHIFRRLPVHSNLISVFRANLKAKNRYFSFHCTMIFHLFEGCNLLHHHPFYRELQKYFNNSSQLLPLHCCCSHLHFLPLVLISSERY